MAFCWSKLQRRNSISNFFHFRGHSGWILLVIHKWAWFPHRQQQNQAVSYCGKGCCCCCICCPNLPCVQCQAWLALAHGHFHGLYQDPPGRIWSLEISLSIWDMRSWRLCLVKGSWKAEPGNKGQALTISCIFVAEYCLELAFYGNHSRLTPFKRSVEQKTGAFHRCICVWMIFFHWS